MANYLPVQTRFELENELVGIVSNIQDNLNELDDQKFMKIYLATSHAYLSIWAKRNKK